MTRAVGRAQGVFAQLTESLLGAAVDLSDLDLTRHPPELVAEARGVWEGRFRSEFRSMQIMARFVTEVLGAGDPLEVWGCAADLVQDEVRHARLCVALCEALGARPHLPEPVVLRDPEPFLRAPMAERALHTAITMLAINETISVAYIEDLRARCPEPAVRRVLDQTLADEEGHQAFGWEYVARSLQRFPASTRPEWRSLVAATLLPHEEAAARDLAAIPESARHLSAHPDHHCVGLGLFSAPRQALVFQQVMTQTLAPRLAALELWP